MKATVADIVKKAYKLPPDFLEHVALDKAHAKTGAARVRSWSGEQVWTTHIEPHKTDPGDRSVLSVTCSCPATRLCQHIVAHYAVAKRMGAEIGLAWIEEGLGLIETGEARVAAGLRVAEGGA